MSYNSENFSRIRRQFDQKALNDRADADRRREELYALDPTFRQIDDALAETGMRIFLESRAGKDGLEKRLAAVREDNDMLRQARVKLLEAHGLPADYTEIRYECPICRDTGYDGQRFCVCFKKALTQASFESSGIGNLMRTQSFESFRTDYYEGADLANIRLVLQICRRYADEFSDEKCRNLMFRGATGLGKTHLSTSIAKVVIERGYDVVYDTVQNIMADFEQQQFGRSYAADQEDLTRRYFDCDLLIMDDLGAEMSSRFTVTSLYNIINTRINRSHSTILNTNLAWDELRKRYSDRITSRLFGEFEPLEFRGSDIRAKKLRS